MSLTISLVPQSDTCAAGTLPSFTAMIRNQGNDGVRICRYMLGYRLLVALKAEDDSGRKYAMQVFQPGQYRDLQPDDFLLLGSGQEVSESLALPALPRNQWGMVPEWSQPSVIPSGHGLTGFVAGSYTFWTAFHDHMGIYRGSAGFQDGNWEVRRVPDDLPGASGGYQDVFHGDIEGRARVRFH